jgi:hypothetical protein
MSRRHPPKVSDLDLQIRSAIVSAQLAALPACDLIRTATALLRIHPDLAAPFTAAAMVNLVPRKEP